LRRLRLCTLQEPQTERREHQDNPNVCYQPLPELVPEEQDVHADHDGYQGQHVISPASANGCARQPPVSPLPVWARSGFTPPDIAMPHVIGAAGNIVAILWATPNALHAPALPNMANKILWVSRVSSGPMTIRATLAGSTRTATVDLPDGPGPSYVDMPAPGCWTLHLSWGGHTDQLSLRYVR
jgi:hypothetical protein